MSIRNLVSFNKKNKTWTKTYYIYLNKTFLKYIYILSITSILIEQKHSRSMRPLLNYINDKKDVTIPLDEYSS